jgi:alkylation response protein AidB-like acyl-CoA dehydrogenase
MSTTIDSVRETANLIRGRADEIEAERRLPEEVIAAIRSTGLNRMGVPAELGGDERPPAEMAAIVEAIAAADGSAGWCAAVGSGTNVFSGYVQRSAAAELWRDPDAANASMFGACGRVSTGDDGPTLTGRWPFVSNCLHSTVIGLGAMPTQPDAAPIPRLFFVPAAEMTVHDTWDVRGLRGTGSHDVSLDEVPIDLARSCSLADQAWPSGTLWRIPLFALLTPPLAAAPLGIAAGSLSDIDEIVREGRVTARGRLVDDPVGLAELACARAALSAARAALYEVMHELWDAASAGDAIPLALRARSWMAAQHAGDVATDVTATAHRLAGSAAVYSGHRLGRALADVTTARQHILFSHHHRPTIAKALAGLEVSAPPVL